MSDMTGASFECSCGKSETTKNRTNIRLPKQLFPNRHTLRMCLNLRERQAALFLAASLAQQVHNYLNAPPPADPQTLRELRSQWRDAAPTLTIQPAPRKAQAAIVKRNSDGPTLANFSTSTHTERDFHRVTNCPVDISATDSRAIFDPGQV